MTDISIPEKTHPSEAINFVYSPFVAITINQRSIWMALIDLLLVGKAMADHLAVNYARYYGPEIHPDERERLDYEKALFNRFEELCPHVEPLIEEARKNILT